MGMPFVRRKPNMKKLFALLALVCLSAGAATTQPAAVRSVDTLGELLSLPPQSFMTGGRAVAQVRGRDVAGDWGEPRVVEFYSSITYPTNIGNTFNYGTTSQWVFADRASATQNVRWWGADKQGLNDSSTAFQSAINAAVVS